jgi:two-component system sensor histidine kinase KdpD
VIGLLRTWQSLCDFDARGSTVNEMTVVDHGLGGNATVGDRRIHKAASALQNVSSLAVPALPCFLCLVGIGACTWVSFRLGLSLGTVGFLYLILVILAASYGGFRQATLVSVVAVGCLDFFFDQPIFSFSVGRLSNWVELGAFEFTALVISQLSNRAQLRAEEAIAERRDTDRLYQAARRMLLLDNRSSVCSLMAALIRDTFELQGVTLYDARSAACYESGAPASQADRDARQAYLTDSDRFDADRETWFCVLRLGGRPEGALALCGTGMRELAAAAVASLVAIALERARTIEKQYHAEAAREAEKLRTAVLDALAHQFKTPLTVIRTASSGLPAAGGLCEEQTELVSIIDQEARKLNDLACRLVSAPMLESTEFQPQLEPLLLSRLMKSALLEVEGETDRERFQLSLPAEEPPVFADRELILTALAQLVDNALKYSVPGSAIDVKLTARETAVILSVRSKGLVVSAADRERIFERFYRAPGAQDRSSGTGLGLSIVKTIAAGQRGHVWAEGEPGYGTVFSLSLPVLNGGKEEAAPC